MFNFAPSGDLMRRLGIIPNQMQQGAMDEAPMQGQIPAMGNAMPGLDLGIPQFLQQFNRPPMGGDRLPPGMTKPGMGGDRTMPMPRITDGPSTPKQGFLGRFMGNMKQGGPAPTDKQMGPGGKMTGMMTNMAPMFGNMLLDDENRRKQALRSF